MIDGYGIGYDLDQAAWRERQDKADAVADYLLDNYGVCTKGQADAECECLRTRWLGRNCLYWKPSGARTLEQLQEAQATLHAALKRTDR